MDLSKLKNLVFNAFDDSVEDARPLEDPDNPFASQTEEQLCGEMDKIKDETKNLLRRYHRQWFYQIAMRIGAQWLQYNPEGYTIMPENEEGHVRMVINRMLSIHQTKLGKIIKNDPWWEIRADQASYKSRKKARKGNKLAEYVYFEQKAKKKLKTLSTWFLDTGTSFLYVYWDANLGEEVIQYKFHAGQVDDVGQAIDEMGQPLGFRVDNQGRILDEGGEPVIEKTYKTGDVAIDVVPPFDIVPFGIKHDGTYKGVIYISDHPTADLKKKYPDIAEDITSDKDDDRQKFYRQIQGIVSNEWYYQTEREEKNKTTLIEELFEEPSERYKDGRHVIRIGKKIVKNGPLPYKHKRIPLIRFVDIENSGQPFGMGTMQNLCPAQKGFNRAFSQLMENANDHAHIKWKATRNADLESDALDNTSEEVIIYNQGANVEQITPAGMPNYFLDIVKNLYPQALQDISGQHDVTMGQAPGEVRSGYGIQQLQSQDDIRNQPTHCDFQSSMAELGEQVLSLYEEHVKDFNGRMFHIRGSGKEMLITPDELEGLWKNVSVRAGTMMNSDLHVNREQIMQLWQGGLFGEPQDPRVRRKVQELYEFGNLDSLFEDVDQDTDWSQEENDLLMEGGGNLVPYTTQDPLKQQLDEQGQPQPVMTLEVSDWEDHDIHKANHDSLRKTREYRLLELARKRAIDAHVDWHMDKILAAQPQSPAEEASASDVEATGEQPA